MSAAVCRSQRSANRLLEQSVAAGQYGAIGGR